MARTIVQKILDAHTLHEEGGRRLVYVDRLVIADTALPVFRKLASEGYDVRRPAQALLVTDHYAPSAGPTLADAFDVKTRSLIEDTERTARDLGISTFGMGDYRRGIQHVVSVEQAYAQPGLTLVGSDSHTSTQGAVGALAFSIGSDLAHTLATQCTWLKPPGMMQLVLDGKLPAGVTTKDVALFLVARIGANGASGQAIEYAGGLIRSLSIEDRMTLCNITAEMGALFGIIGPDETTFSYLKGRPFAPRAFDWELALETWRKLPTDPDALFDRSIAIDVSDLAPMVTWGNSTESGLPITGRVPNPEEEANPERRRQMSQALDYMGLVPDMPMAGLTIDQVFIGSCSNSRLSDLRAAAVLLRGRKTVVPTLVVPGSGAVKAQAEAEGLDIVFRSAGASWGEPGCSMCVSMNGDIVPPGARCASTSNRNHMGRQGRGSRTHLVSPPMAAAAAITGCLTDVRTMTVN